MNGSEVALLMSLLCNDYTCPVSENYGATVLTVENCSVKYGLFLDKKYTNRYGEITFVIRHVPCWARGEITKPADTLGEQP